MASRRPARADCRASEWGPARDPHLPGVAVAAITSGRGPRVGQAPALAEARGAEAGLGALDAIPPDTIATYQPYWALRAHLLRRLGRADPARQAYAQAIGLSEDTAVREFLVTQVSAVDPS